ncbi:IMP dehydrogenase [Candidatus Kinetoplastidibacterium crithidiae]|uniref:Inosine-5'-monophosphate dehydrogenase n=1 Tax=Candidatus Kinetoplastidibacterium crithidiae TCC036E TaxID=1208918 RepID=M1M6A1_9PROT|nr:IMP dehydrogenase [Candidatus Kinetoplastibacterium crithidii]AGF47635.1 IMP dehydrogenase [Candidatus Kinetoplastibacterium crithidii TCC036E]EPY25349.1 IMP dehydrogenase [Angomonas deanei]EPY40105.1 inosine-5'-monophosphate dehydrogenase [Angomonas deanei]|eukprot:EPY25349.1 IMP dehydrogenase [Angomonas deanei]
MLTLKKAFTFDDVLLVPAYSEILPKNTSLTTKLTKNIELKIPFVSAAMDTVTEFSLAIALAQEGGIGIIHKNLTPDQQAHEVSRVKRHEFGIVIDPITVTPNMNVAEAINLQRKFGISGLPVVENGKVVGIITNRDLRFETNLNQPLKNVMTPKERLVVMEEGATLLDAQALMHKHRLERVLIVNSDFELRGLATVKDIVKNTEHPTANKDSRGQLRVGAAVGIGNETTERVEKLVHAGVDVIVVDTAHGHSLGVLKTISWIKSNYPQIDIIGGNIATARAAKALAEHGADGVKVGIGPGSICTTRIISGVGVPQITAISEVAKALNNTDVSIIADGGIRYSGDIAKAIAAGAHSCMMGSIFAGTSEAPGEESLFQGRTYKSYRGMGSIGAMEKGSADRYFQGHYKTADKLVPEGVEGRVPYKGSVISIIYQLIGGLRAAMGYCGCATINDLRTKTEFVEITSAGVSESHVHDIHITKEAPNYRSE